MTLALANWTNGGYYQAQNTSAPQPTLGSLSTEREDEGQHEQSVFPSDEKRQHDAKCDGWLHGPLCPKAFNVLSTTPITAAKLQEAWRKSVVPEDADVVTEKDPDFYSLVYKVSLFPRKSTALVVMRHPFMTYTGAAADTLCEDAPACLAQWSATWAYTLTNLRGHPFAVVRSEGLSDETRLAQLISLATGLVPGYATIRPKRVIKTGERPIDRKSVV